jgi:hypothetical protein
VDTLDGRAEGVALVNTTLDSDLGIFGLGENASAAVVAIMPRSNDWKTRPIIAVVV